jgi:DNA-binding response OmpR family regulator
MIKQKFYVINSIVLHAILVEVIDNFDFELIDTKNFSKDDFDKKLNTNKIPCIALESQKQKLEKFINSNYVVYLNNLPIKISKLIEKINIKFLNLNFKSQSKISVKDYEIDLNARKIMRENEELKLTEREIEIILFLFDKNIPQKVDDLQTEIWQQKIELETHTVETHIYRLRKKISDTFGDNDFIKSNELGYSI